MLATLTVIIVISTIFFTIRLGYLGTLNIASLVALVTASNLAQWRARLDDAVVALMSVCRRPRTLERPVRCASWSI